MSKITENLLILRISQMCDMGLCQEDWSPYLQASFQSRAETNLSRLTVLHTEIFSCAVKRTKHTRHQILSIRVKRTLQS